MIIDVHCVATSTQKNFKLLQRRLQCLYKETGQDSHARSVLKTRVDDQALYIAPKKSHAPIRDIASCSSHKLVQPNIEPRTSNYFLNAKQTPDEIEIRVNSHIQEFQVSLFQRRRVLYVLITLLLHLYMGSLSSFFQTVFI
jgi:hypothetical protein